ncbi:MAG: hypothetical protein FJ146_02160 [Deltaproteobacteria bacterium]|nr:hypothetical protein [Deltaproteobacteria bacterium]
MIRNFHLVAGIATSIFFMILASPRVALADDLSPREFSAAGLTEIGIENGGVIILHTIYRSCDGECGKGKFVMVAPESEIAALRAEFANESNLRILVKISDEDRDMSFDAQITACPNEQAFTGRIISSGESFYVVGEKYAVERGWI